LVYEARENENIHNSHPNFVHESMINISTTINDMLEYSVLKQYEIKSLINSIIVKIDYQRYAAYNRKYMNVYTFYNSVIDCFDELVNIVE
jgi:hypothetical protein